MKAFKNWVVLITGCSSGLGRAMAIEFAKQGHTVFATSRRVEDIRDLESDSVITLQLDVTNATSITAALEKVKRHAGGINLLVNNAGFGLMGPLVEIPLDEIRRQFETNVIGALAVVQAVFPYMVKQGGGRIINVGSVSGILTTPFAGPYCASKAAFHSLSDAMRMELAPFGIKVITLEISKIKSKFGETAERILKELTPQNSFYSPIFSSIEMRAKVSQIGAKDAKEFARRIVCTVTRESPPPLFHYGKDSWKIPIYKLVIPIKLMDNALSKMFGLHLLQQRLKS